MEKCESNWDVAMDEEEQKSWSVGWEREAENVAEHTRYNTAVEHGERQMMFLKALDFADEVGPDIRVYNVCTQDDWQFGKCGLAFPSKRVRGVDSGTSKTIRA